MVTGEANFRVREDVRITGIKVSSFENEGYETYTAEYYKDGTKVMVTLPETNSTVTYEVEIKNTSEESYQLKEIKDEITSNPQMKYEIQGLSLEDIIGPSETKTFQIVVSYQDETSEVPSEIAVTFETRYVFEKVQVTPPQTGNTFAEYLKSIANPDTITTYADESGNKQEMYTFNHGKTEQTGELIDYRYIGDSPNNYVYFNCKNEPQNSSNCETWRVIGVFPVENEKGNIEERVKIIKDTSIGDMAWNSSGVNNWETASLNVYLNGTYYNGLSDAAKTMIENAKYYLGGSSTEENLGGPDYYKFERGTTTYQSSRPTYWAGKIALMYPSDYVYTYALGANDKCYTDAYNCNPGSPTSGWLYMNNNKTEWTLVPYSGTSGLAFYVGLSGRVYSSVNVASSFEVRPALYLASSVSIVDGDGCSGNPYQLKARTMVETLKSKTNEGSVTNYEEGTKTEMYTFKHEATEQTDELTDYRYIGNDPYNYVYFNCNKEPQSSSNCETWRIIGIFPVEDENGNMEERMKIIRDTSIGDQAWNNSSYTNNWEKASLNTYLNGTYYNGLSEAAQAMIGDTKYYLGGSGTLSGLAGPDYYKFERGTTVYKSGTTVYPTSWLGKIALMYPSDYVYTYALGVNDKCYTDAQNCEHGSPSLGWLFSSTTQWTLTPNPGLLGYAFYVYSSGYVNPSYYVTNTYGVRPVLYLSSVVSIVDGDGSSGDPYQLAIK